MEDIQTYKSFFKIYQQIEGTNFLVTVVGIENLDTEEFMAELEELFDDDFSFIPTTFETYIDFKNKMSYGLLDAFDDNIKQNISC
jgi:hypothetical protein